ncbi:hypothetical protein HY312_01300 [Candidatus Saccharibacteria bacterium]|nr:hypothetical protein [Candidatus Saccharibacteria bacterium]
MGFDRFTRSTYQTAHQTYVPTRGRATGKAEELARNTGKLDPLVDPAAYGVIRRSLVRFSQRSDGLYVVTAGLPVSIEQRLDTTGSMGRNVENVLKVLPDTYDLVAKMLPGADPHMAIGIFADCVDRFVLCRPQFEMTADKIVHQLTLMVPEGGGGGNGGEDPQYGLFGAAYLTAAYINRIGLKGYDFTITDEPARAYLDESQLKRVFGEDVFDKVSENGHEISKNELLSTKQVIDDLLKRAHAFVLIVGDSANTARFWPSVIDESRIIQLPDVELLPQVQAAIIGLTEGTLTLQSLEEFLLASETGRSNTDAIVRSVSNIPIGAQTVLENFGKGPKVGDVFREKTDLWPMDPSEVPELTDEVDEGQEGPDWL